MLRSLVFTALLHLMPEEFGQLEQCPRDLAGLVITDVCQMVENEGWKNPYDACVEFTRRVTPPDNHPGFLTRYAEGLLAQQEARTFPGVIPADHHAAMAAARRRIGN